MSESATKRISITQPITDFGVSSENSKKNNDVSQDQASEFIHEAMSRPEMLVGSTYKIKPPTADNALYITINDVILNQGTENEVRRPFEVFLNSKNMDHFQWVVALTRVMSAVFRKGGDVTFLVDELKNVFDPQGGYFKPGGRFMPSLVAEIGYAIETHMKNIGLIVPEVMPEHQRKILDEKRDSYLESKGEVAQEDGYPESAQVCKKCHTKAAIFLDGCLTCLECGSSHCS